MTRKRWTTEPQQDHLDGLVGAHTKARDEGQLTRFWDELFEGWFTKFPEAKPNPTGDEKGDLAAFGTSIEKRKKVSGHVLIFKSIQFTAPTLSN